MGNVVLHVNGTSMHFTVLSTDYIWTFTAPLPWKSSRREENSVGFVVAESEAAHAFLMNVQLAKSSTDNFLHCTGNRNDSNHNKNFNIH